jgi:hypothetical protein
MWDSRRRGEGVVDVEVINAKPREMCLGVGKMFALSARFEYPTSVPCKNVPQRVGTRYVDHWDEGTRNVGQDPRGVVVYEEHILNSLLLRGVEGIYDRLTRGG